MVGNNPCPLVRLGASGRLSASRPVVRVFQRALGALLRHFFCCDPLKGIGNSRLYAARDARDANTAPYMRACIKRGTGQIYQVLLLYIPPFFLPYRPYHPCFYFYHYFSTS